jgi:hypothetical protein
MKTILFQIKQPISQRHANMQRIKQAFDNDILHISMRRTTSLIPAVMMMLLMIM